MFHHSQDCRIPYTYMLWMIGVCHSLSNVFISSKDNFMFGVQMVCSQSSEFRCNNVCGNPLACGNHTCSSTCHFISFPRVVVGEEILERIVTKPSGVELPDPSDAPEGVWGKYGSSLPTEDFSDTEKLSGSASMTERMSAKSTSSRPVDCCECCLLPCQKVCWQLFPTIKRVLVCLYVRGDQLYPAVLQSAKDCKKLCCRLRCQVISLLSGWVSSDWVVSWLYRSDLFHVHIHVPKVAILEIADRVKQLLNVPATVRPWLTHLSALCSTLPLRPQKWSY